MELSFFIGRLVALKNEFSSILHKILDAQTS